MDEASWDEPDQHEPGRSAMPWDEAQWSLRWSRDGVLRIDCDECVMRDTEVCADCVVTFVCSREPDEALVIDVTEVRALRLLGEAGLVPRLRHRRRTG